MLPYLLFLLALILPACVTPQCENGKREVLPGNTYAAVCVEGEWQIDPTDPAPEHESPASNMK